MEISSSCSELGVMSLGLITHLIKQSLSISMCYSAQYSTTLDYKKDQSCELAGSFSCHAWLVVVILVYKVLLPVLLHVAVPRTAACNR